MSHKLIYYGQIFSANKMKNPFAYGIKWQNLIFITNPNLLNHIKKRQRLAFLFSTLFFKHIVSIQNLGLHIRFCIIPFPKGSILSLNVVIKNTAAKIIFLIFTLLMQSYSLHSLTSSPS